MSDQQPPRSRPGGAHRRSRACQQTRYWQAAIPDYQQLSISVNLSAVQLAQPHLAGEIAQTLATIGLEPRHLPWS